MALRRVLTVSLLALPLACGEAGGDGPLSSADATLVSTEVRAPTAELRAGVAMAVGCVGRYSDGGQRPLDAAVTVSPSESATVEAGQLVIERAGSYELRCPVSGAEAAATTIVVRPGDAARLLATLTPPTLPVGERATVLCEAEDAFGNVALATGASIEATSVTGVSIVGSEVEARVPGEYGVRCGLGRLSSADATLTVIPGAPVRLIAALDRYEVRAGEPVAVRCEAEDIGMNRVPVGAELRVSPAPERADASGFVPARAEPHQVRCALSGLESAPVELTVRPGLPAEIHVLGVLPAQAIYARNDTVELSVRMLDAFANEVPAATLEVRGTPEIAALAAGNGRAVLLGSGVIPLTVKITSATHEGRTVEDSVSVTVDGTAPEIVLDSPARGEIVVGRPGTPITVRGRVTDDLSAISSLSVGGADVPIGAGGAFAVTVTPSWGINLVEALAVDAAGNTRAISAAFELASSYRRASPSRLSSGKIDDGIVLHLGAAALDDNATDVDDLATIARLAVERIDLRTLIPSPVTNFHSDCSIPFFDITGDLRLYVDRVQYASPSFDFTPIAGGLRLRVEVNNVQVNLHTSGDVCDIGMGLSGSARATRIVVNSDLMVSASGGRVSARVSSQNVSISGLSIDLNLPSIIDWAVDGIINLFSGAISNELEGAFGDVIASEVPPVIEGFLGSVELATGFDLPAPLNLHLGVDARLGTIAFSPGGGNSGQAATIYAQGVISPEPIGAILQESRAAPSFDLTRALGVGISYDLANQALYSLWYGGGLRFDLDEALFPSQLPNGVRAEASLDAKLPLVVRPSGDPAFPLELQAGELALDVDLSGLAGLPPMRATLHAGFIAKASVTIDARGQIQLGLAPNPTISLEIDSAIEGVVDLVGFTETLERMLSTLLPELVGRVLRGIPLPTFDLSQIAGGYLPSGIVLGVGQPAVRVQPSYLVLEGNVVRAP